MMVHIQRVHEGESYTVTQVDKSCWKKLIEAHPIPQHMPSLPVVSLNKERKKPRPVTPVKEDPEEPQIIRLTKLVTPLKKKPTLAPRKTVKQRLAKEAENVYIPTPLNELKERELMTQIKCKRSQRDELTKIAAAIDLEIHGLNKTLQKLRDK